VCVRMKLEVEVLFGLWINSQKGSIAKEKGPAFDRSYTLVQQDTVAF
jgi:hypothetical protein